MVKCNQVRETYRYDKVPHVLRCKLDEQHALCKYICMHVHVWCALVWVMYRALID